MAKPLKNRATALVNRDCKVLLVRGSSVRFRGSMMPGGGIENVELPIVAAASELHEETNLRASSIEYLLPFEAAIYKHVVFRVEAEGDVKIGPEIGAFVWWDQREELPLFPHVRGILQELG